MEDRPTAGKSVSLTCWRGLQLAEQSTRKRYQHDAISSSCSIIYLPSTSPLPPSLVRVDVLTRYHQVIRKRRNEIHSTGALWYFDVLTVFWYFSYTFVLWRVILCISKYHKVSKYIQPILCISKKLVFWYFEWFLIFHFEISESLQPDFSFLDIAAYL